MQEPSPDIPRHCQIKAWKQAGDLYIHSARKLNFCPWLAQHYYEQAVKRYKQSLEGYPFVCQIACEASLMAQKHSLIMKEADWLELALQKRIPGINYSAIEKRFKTCSNFEIEGSSIDKDILSQWIACKESYFEVMLEAFRLYQHPYDSYFQNRTHTKIIDIVIKLRHILDHAFGRFTTAALYPNNIICVSDLKYPCYDNEELLRHALVDEVLKSDNSAFTMLNHPLWNDLRFRSAYEAICSTQPFKGKTWFKELHLISNSAKHNRIIFPEFHILQHNKEKATWIEGFYPALIPEGVQALALLDEALNESWQAISVLSTFAI